MVDAFGFPFGVVSAVRGEKVVGPEEWLLEDFGLPVYSPEQVEMVADGRCAGLSEMFDGGGRSGLILALSRHPEKHVGLVGNHADDVPGGAVLLESVDDMAHRFERPRQMILGALPVLYW